MPVIERMTGVSMPGARLEIERYQIGSIRGARVVERKNEEIPVHPVLAKHLARAGITRPEGADGRSLSKAQIERLVEGRDVSERIELKHLIWSHGLLPHDHVG